MTTYIITNNTDGSYKTPSLYIPNNSFKIKVISLFVNRSYYTSNTTNPTICVHSKQISKHTKVKTNSGQDEPIFCFSGNGTTTQHIVHYPDIMIYFANSSNINKFDDFEFRSIDGTLLNLTTNSVRFQIVITVY